MTDEIPACLEMENSDAWQALACKFADFNFEQSMQYSLAAARRVGASPIFVIVGSTEKPIAAASVRVKNISFLNQGLAYLPAGPLSWRNPEGTWDEVRMKSVLASLKKKFVDDDGHVLRVRLPVMPPLPPETDFDSLFADAGFVPSKRGRSYETILMDLGPDPDKLRSALRQGWRRHLNFSMKSDLDTEVGTGREFRDRFEKIFVQVRDEKGFQSGLSPEFFFDLPWDENNIMTILLKKDGQDVAGHMLTVFGNTAVYLFGATNDIGRKFKAGYLLNWTAMLLAKERGCRWYDLGGIDEHGNPGVFQLKSRMGGERCRAIGPFEARPAGFVPKLIDGIETIRQTLRRH